MGHASREAGKSFEERVEDQIITAQQTLVVAWYAHQQPLVTRTGKPIKQSGADFIGILTGGCSLAIECKSTAMREGDPDKIQRNAFTVEQQAHLDAAAKNGHLALAGLEFREPTSGVMHAFLVPWLAIPWRRATKHESVRLQDIDDGYRMAADNALKWYVRKCTACGAWWPVTSYHTSCCFGALPF